MNKLKVERVIIFKHGVSYFILKGHQKGSGKFELEFKIDEMNDILKSLFVLDTSEQGFISSISYDAALNVSHLLKSIMLEIPDRNSLSSLVTQIKGAVVNIKHGTDLISGTVMGIEEIDKFIKDIKIIEKMLVLLKEDGVIVKLPFSEISSFKILNEDLRKDLKFYLDTIISSKKKDSKKIIINCESGGNNDAKREIVVSYIRESPIWKTSYRLIMSKQQGEQHKCLISGWCMVENTTNQDWENIDLTLMAGMPVSFIYNFYHPIFIKRLKLDPPRVLGVKPFEIEEQTDYGAIGKAIKQKTTGASPDRARGITVDLAPNASEVPKIGFATDITGGLSDSGLINKLRQTTKTQTKDVGELFEYNISNPVSIKRKQSALVPILTEEIEARKILLYNKNENLKYPSACLEIKNNTELILERGPVTIVYDNNLAGEAIIPFMNKGDKRLINYAVEQGVLISVEQKIKNQNIHRIKLSNSYCYEYHYTIIKTNYKIKNKIDEIRELYIDHPKIKDNIIKESPVEPEETTNYWRFKISLKPKESILFDIKEQEENYASYYLWDQSKEDLLNKISFYIRKTYIDEDTETELKKIAMLLGNLNNLKNDKSKLINEREEMTIEQERIRKNISVLGDSTQEGKLKEKYVMKLSEQENRYEIIKAEIERVDKEIKELTNKIEKELETLKI